MNFSIVGAILWGDHPQPYEVKGQEEDIRQEVPARQDWLLDAKRHGVVVIIRDQETKEILQPTYQPFCTAASRRCHQVR